MRKFENVDIINSLRRIMNINTEHYKNDFFLDVDTIHTAAAYGFVYELPF